MKKIIEDVLEDLAGSQLNFESKTARQTIVSLLTDTLNSKGIYKENSEDDSGSYLEPMEEKINSIPNDMKLGEKIRTIKEQIYREMTADGLPQGGDAQAILESQRLAEEIVNAQKDEWIFESPDGETIFRRPAGNYDSDYKEEIDWETKEPTGRVFSDYNNGNWKDGK